MNNNVSLVVKIFWLHYCCNTPKQKANGHYYLYNMVNSLFFCATLTGRRGGHTLFFQAGAETPDKHCAGG